VLEIRREREHEHCNKLQCDDDRDKREQGE
jgi:hypothetical protein